MKTLTIGSVTIEIKHCTRRRDTVKGFFLDLEIPKESIGMNELYTLLDNNAEPIVVVDEDGTENTYLGFKEIGSFALEGGAYHVAQVCTSEYEAQLSLAQTKIAEQDAVIEAQNNHVASLEEMSVAQLSAIDSILTEVVPTIIELAVMQAIEAVTPTEDIE